MGRKPKRRFQERDVSWQVWRQCGLCDGMYCSNNYQDHKIRLKRWHGVELCATCQYKVLPALKRAMDLKILKFTKKHKPEKK